MSIVKLLFISIEIVPVDMFDQQMNSGIACKTALLYKFFCVHY